MSSARKSVHITHDLKYTKTRIYKYILHFPIINDTLARSLMWIHISALYMSLICE